MLDRVPLYPGRVKLTPVSGQENVYDMVRADQPTQEGTPLNKASLLKDATAALFDLGSSAVPDDMLNALAHTGDLHVWKRTQNGQVDYPVSPNPNAYQEGSNEQPAGYTLGEVQSGYFVLSNQSSSGWAMSWNYSNSVSVTEDGVVSLSNPASTEITGNMSFQAAQSAAALIKGKFVSCTGSQSYFQANTVYFIPSDAVITSTGSQVWVNKYQTVTGYPATPASTTIEYMGQIGGFGDRAQIVTGSYVGNGLAGYGNKNKLTFASPPKLVSIGDGGGNNAGGGFAWVNGSIRVYSAPYGTCKLTWDGNTLYWYAENSQSSTQFNVSGTTYYYAAIL